MWTAPKGVEVPAIPWRRVALSATAAVVGLMAAGVVVVPLIEEGKRDAERRERTEREAAARREEARLREDQRLHIGKSSLRDAGGAPAESRRVRRILRRELEAAITRDARGRVRRGALDGPIVDTNCVPSRPADAGLSSRSGLFKCFVVSGESVGARGVPLVSGYPFVATIDYRDGTLAWCKTNPRAGEKAGGSTLARVRLSRACAGRLADVL